MLCPRTLLSRAGCRLSLYLLPWPFWLPAPQGQVLGNCRKSIVLGSSHAASATSRLCGPGPLCCRCDTRALMLTHSCLLCLLRCLGTRSQLGEPCRWNQDGAGIRKEAGPCLLMAARHGGPLGGWGCQPPFLSSASPSFSHASPCFAEMGRFFAGR